MIGLIELVIGIILLQVAIQLYKLKKDTYNDINKGILKGK